MDPFAVLLKIEPLGLKAEFSLQPGECLRLGSAEEMEIPLPDCGLDDHHLTIERQIDGRIYLVFFGQALLSDGDFFGDKPVVLPANFQVDSLSFRLEGQHVQVPTRLESLTLRKGVPAPPGPSGDVSLPLPKSATKSRARRSRLIPVIGLLALGSLGVGAWWMRKPPETPTLEAPATLRLDTPQVGASALMDEKENENQAVNAEPVPKVTPPPVVVPDLSQGFTNSLNMKFVRVPGTGVFFCEHETRIQDYAAYAGANPEASMAWKDYESDQAPDHPVINVSWEEASAFCEWLGAKEGKSYRLPTDHEWSVAVGINRQEDQNARPKDKDGKVDGYPWGLTWPPSKGAGNFGPELSDYSDSHPFTAPVKSYEKNRHGLYDLGGNVWEWCEDWFSDEQSRRVLRGGSWGAYSEFYLRSSCRRSSAPTYRGNNYGFRCVVDVGG